MKNPLLVLLALSGPCLAFCQTSSTFDFNTPGQLVTEFTQGGNANNISQTMDGGIGNTGSISVTGTATEVFTSKEAYSISGEGASYQFSTYFKNDAINGYGGIGFTANPNATYSQFAAPNDAIGISVHSSGYIFHSGTSYQSNSWTSSINNLLSNGSPDDWYLAIFKVQQGPNAIFEMDVKIYSVYEDGSLVRPYPDAQQSWMAQNFDLANASAIHAYFSFGGDTIHFFDQYSIELNGASIIQEGHPVVIGNALPNTNTIAMNGEVTDDRGHAVTARGFVWSTTHTSPTLDDTVVLSGDGLGNFTEQLSNLNIGDTYYIRSFATNSEGTSFSQTSTINMEALSTSDPNQIHVNYYPNPAKDRLNFTTTTPIESYTIHNSLGRQLVTQALTPSTSYVDISQLNTGMYFVSFKSQHGSKTYKILKQ